MTRSSAARANVLGSAATVVISIAQAFLLMPLCLAVLGKHVYGAWLAAAELLTWIQLLDFGIPNLMTQRIGAAVGSGDRAASGRWFSTGLLILVGIAALLLLAGLVASPLITAWAQVPAAEASRFTACFRVAVVASGLLLLFNAFVSLARGLQRTTLINAASVGGAVTNLVVSLQLLLLGWGLWALAAGLAARAFVSIAGGLLMYWRVARDGHLAGCRPDRAVSAEILSLAPPMAGASVGYLLANYSEIMLVTTLFGPGSAAVYALTRRAVDGIKSLLDTIAWGVYGGFAHLVESADRSRSRVVLADVLSLRFGAACLAGAIYLAVNEGFVVRLYGTENFGGLWLTAAFAAQMVVAGQSFLVNYLYRAAGQVRRGSHLLTGEALGRALAMLASLRVGGLIAAPWAATVTSGAAMLAARAGLRQILPAGPEPSRAVQLRRGVAAVAVLVTGLLIGALAPAFSWSRMAITAALIGAAGGAILVLAQPVESRRRILLSWTRP
ncbi:MAG: oligosaccharide flippase family protein [Vicinamibacterales bacterium]